MLFTTAQNFKLELSRALSHDIEIPSPKGKVYFPYQKAGIYYSVLSKNTFFGDPPGVGKTIQSIGFMNYEGIKKVLIICPSSVVYNWERELKAWHVGNPTIEIFNSKTFTGKSDILIVGYGYLSRLEPVKQILKKFSYKLCVIDEIHFLKNTKAKRTKFVLAKNGLMSKAARVHGLSGTPMVNRPIELYPAIKALCPKAIDDMSFFEFALKYCDAFKNGFGWDFNGASNLPELGKRLRAHCMVRRPKDKILKELPPKFENLVYIEADSKAKKLISKMKKYDENTVVKSGFTVKFDELSELRRLLGEAKIESIIEYVRTQFESGHEKIILFAHHKKVIEELKKGLAEYNPVVISGEVASLPRQTAVDKFQTDPATRLFIGSITSAGIGITLTASSYVIFGEFSWVPGENEQARDRAHRIGAKDCVLVDYLVFADSLDERILKQLLKKQKAINELTN